MLRGEVPRLFDRSLPMRLGKARQIGAGTDVAVFSSSICTEEALRATAALKQKGVGIRHLHISTHKPFNDPAILEAIEQARYGVVTMENHTIVGGLGTAVAELIADHGIGARLVRIGLQDTFAHGASRPYLMRKYGLDAMSLVRAIEQLLNVQLGITEEDLAAVPLTRFWRQAEAAMIFHSPFWLFPANASPRLRLVGAAEARAPKRRIFA
jgi:transketolase